MVFVQSYTCSYTIKVLSSTLICSVWLSLIKSRNWNANDRKHWINVTIQSKCMLINCHILESYWSNKKEPFVCIHFVSISFRWSKVFGCSRGNIAVFQAFIKMAYVLKQIYKAYRTYLVDYSGEYFNGKQFWTNFIEVKNTNSKKSIFRSKIW